MENDLMTVNPVNNPFHNMSAPVLSAFELDFPNTLVKLRNSYVNLMQFLGINGKWLLSPSDDNLILISKHGLQSSFCDYNDHWDSSQSRHVARIIMPTSLQSGHDIKTVTDTINECCHCKGISDPKYYPLVLKNNGFVVTKCVHMILLYFRWEVVGILWPQSMYHPSCWLPPHIYNTRWSLFNIPV